ncbi:AAA family ATPase [Arthrobacter sp. 31Y]|uniref:AAA family ATPase n=1 Tax=Arthrobacter sp. 31Y TaxID=1115632 RepID=UPI000463DC69|nr:AAA family ATPase [Arthrobacter sp. 31Y]
MSTNWNIPTTTDQKHSLQQDLRNRSNSRICTQILWKTLGFDIPVVETMEEVSALGDKGLPSYLKDPATGLTQFGPALLWDDHTNYLAELKTEFLKAQSEEEDADLRAQNRLKSVTDMLKTPEIDWLVQDKIHRSGLFQIFGASYTGKTLLILDLTMSWCAGLPEWQGYKLNNDGKPQDAVYVAAEGGAALSVHVDAWLKYHKDVDPSRLNGLLFLDGGEGHHMFLGIGKEQPDPEDGFMRLAREINEAEINPSLVVFDTQIDLAPGIDENSNTDMVGVLREVKRLGDSLGFMAIVVHHTGHDGNKARGASGMMGKCDVQAKLTSIGERSGKAKLEWTKVKGRAQPEDTISYKISGYKELDWLDSEGAVCVPLSKLEQAYAVQEATRPTDELQRNIMNAINIGKTSSRAIAEEIGINKDSPKLREALVWMQEANLITKTGSGPKTAYSLSAMSVSPSEY